MQDKTGIQVNFFAEGTFILKTQAGKNLSLVQETKYPESGDINLMMNLEKSEELSVRIRIPAWSVKQMISVNGQFLEGIESGSYYEIRRRWADEDRIQIRFEMEGSLIRRGETRM